MTLAVQSDPAGTSYDAFKRLPRQVEAVMLFGSGARGDQDSSSDVDLVVFAKARRGRTLQAIKNSLERECVQEKSSITLYAMQTAEEMADKGSLFLWHLRLEGRIVYSSSDWLRRLLVSLRPYSREAAVRDIDTLRLVLHDIQGATLKGSPTDVFEAATLFTVLRNTAIVAAFVSDRPLFGRRAPVEWLKSKMGWRFPYSVAEIDFLANRRLAYNGKQELDSRMDRHSVALLATTAGQVLDFAAEVVSYGD